MHFTANVVFFLYMTRPIFVSWAVLWWQWGCDIKCQSCSSEEEVIADKREKEKQRVIVAFVDSVIYQITILRGSATLRSSAPFVI